MITGFRGWGQMCFGGHFPAFHTQAVASSPKWGGEEVLPGRDTLELNAVGHWRRVLYSLGPCRIFLCLTPKHPDQGVRPGQGMQNQGSERQGMKAHWDNGHRDREVEGVGTHVHNMNISANHMHFCRINLATLWPGCLCSP